MHIIFSKPYLLLFISHQDPVIPQWLLLSLHLTLPTAHYPFGIYISNVSLGGHFITLHYGPIPNHSLDPTPPWRSELRL